MRTVLDGYVLRAAKTERAIQFDYLKARGLAELNADLFSRANGGGGILSHTSLKMAAVGWRTGELYGNPKMFGFEVRALNPTDNDPAEMRFVNAVQKGIVTHSYGLPRTELEAWHETNVGSSGTPEKVLKRQSDALQALHYNRSIDKLLETAPEALQSSLTPEVVAQLKAKAGENYGLKMLVHDWSKDPALARYPRTRSAVVDEQKEALSVLRKPLSDSELKRVVKVFVKRSRLSEVFAASLGTKDPSVQ
jgi:hypothetical protein